MMRDCDKTVTQMKHKRSISKLYWEYNRKQLDTQEIV